MDNNFAKLGFSGAAWINWKLGIPDEILGSQTMYYWLRSFVTEVELKQEPRWAQDDLARVFVDAYGMDRSSAERITGNCHVEMLLTQTPAYWVRDWILRHEQKASNEFVAFVDVMEPGVVCEFVLDHQARHTQFRKT